MTEYLPINEVLKALYDRLKAELSIPIFDYVPPKEEYPYITLGAPSASGACLKDAPICDVTIPIDIWTIYLGAKQLIDYADEVIVAVTQSDLDIISTGFQVICTTFSDFTSDKIPTDDQTAFIYHGTLRFTWKVDKL